MPANIPHERIRELGDRSWTRTLLELVSAPDTASDERDKAFHTLVWLEDYRSVDPLSGIVEDSSQPTKIRTSASEVIRGMGMLETTGVQRRTWWASGDPVLMAHSLALMERTEADIVEMVASDDSHPLHGLAIRTLTFSFDEAKFQRYKITGLRHPDSRVRTIAAEALLWDEPVEAELPLLEATYDPVPSVALAAIDALQYYPTRRVLRALAELASNSESALYDKAAESFEYVRGCFESSVYTGSPEFFTRLGEWLAPVSDLIEWPPLEEKQHLHTPKPSHPLVPVPDLLAMLAESDGEWEPKISTLHKIPADKYREKERDQLTEALSMHPDPLVREAATSLLAAWSRTDALLSLADDPYLLVRKPAMYYLADLPPSPTIAQKAWSYLSDAGGVTASEALRTYLHHAPPSEASVGLGILARNDPRECVQVGAISCLAELGATKEIEMLAPLLQNPPAVTWAVHIEELRALKNLGIKPPSLDNLAQVDNLDLFISVLALSDTETP